MSKIIAGEINEINRIHNTLKEVEYFTKKTED